MTNRPSDAVGCDVVEELLMSAEYLKVRQQVLDLSVELRKQNIYLSVVESIQKAYEQIVPKNLQYND